MSNVNVWIIPEDRQPPWVKKKNPALWCEVSCQDWNSYKELILWLDKVCPNSFDIHQARPFQEFPRVYYVMINEEKDKLAFKLAWINLKESEFEK